MEKSDCKIGMQVYFGRENGQKTLGKIIKLNPTKAKVETLEARGIDGRSKPGSVWSVPYVILKPADPSVIQDRLKPISIQSNPLTFNFFDHINNLILEAIVACYNQLSPENLTADGERPMAQVRMASVRLERQLRALIAAYNGPVASLTEEVVYAWYDSRRKFFEDKQIRA